MLLGRLRKLLEFLLLLAEECKSLRGLIYDGVHERARPIRGQRNLAFMTEATFRCGGLDLNLMND